MRRANSTTSSAKTSTSMLSQSASASRRNCDALLDREHRLLVLRVADDADDDALEDPGGARDDVEVAVRDRVVAPRADGGDRRRVAHCVASKRRHARRAVAAARPQRQRKVGLLLRLGLDDDEPVGGEDGGQMGRRAWAGTSRACGRAGRPARDRNACPQRHRSPAGDPRPRGTRVRPRARACRGCG